MWEWLAKNPQSCLNDLLKLLPAGPNGSHICQHHCRAEEVFQWRSKTRVLSKLSSVEDVSVVHSHF